MAATRTPHNGTLLRAVHALHVCALGLWTGTIAMTAVAASVIFPTAKSLELRVPRYSATPESDQWLLAAGHIAARVFGFADSMQLACATTTVVTCALLARAHGIGRSAASKLRVLALIGAVLLALFYLGILAPRMTTHLHEHWRLSEAGRLDEARVHEAAFKGDHPTSSRVLGATGLCALLALLLGAGSPTPAHRAEAKDQT